MNWREKIEAQIALINNYLGNGGFFNPELMDHDKVRDMVMDNRAALQALLDVAVAAEDDRVCAEANCGKTGGDRDCSAYISRGLRCSDCPVEVWLASTVEALDKLREVGDD